MAFESCWKRIKNEFGVKNFVQLSEIIGQSTSNIAKKKKKNEFPVEWAYKVAKEFNVLTEWILTGIGPKTLIDVVQYSENTVNNDDIEEMCDYVECHWNKKFVKKVPLILGALYEIDPVNPSKNKMRGEKVILIEIGFVGPTTCLRIDSKWHLKRRDYGEIDPCDLRLISKKPDFKKLGISDS